MPTKWELKGYLKHENRYQQERSESAGPDILKISSKSVHNFLSYLSLKIKFHGFCLFRHILKISSKSIHKFLSYFVQKQTHKPTNKPRQKHNLLGGGN